MRHLGDSVTDLQIAYIGGGSREWAAKLMADLALEDKLSGTVKLYDIDLKAARENEQIGNSIAGRPETVGKWKYETVETLEKALTGADFVIISILPGTYEEMASDVHLPEEYGIYQAVGDTVGPGGLMRALRTIPIYVEFAEKIRQYSPEAWVINYTNPMTLCTRTLFEVFPEIKAFGCCHEVFHTQKLMAVMLEDLKGLKNVSREDIKVNVLGINHFTWFDKASYQGMDLFPIYREFAAKYFEAGFQIPDEETWHESYFRSMHRVKFDLFQRFGLIAAAGDRHLAEFMPKWYLKDPETVKAWKFRLTPVSFRANRQEQTHIYRQRLIAGQEKLEIKPSGEEGVLQIKALLGLGDLVTNINLPNEGQMKGFPEKAVVETNAYLTRNGIRPVIAGELPPPVRSLVLRHVMNQEATLKAAMNCDYSLALQAFMNDPLVTVDPVKGEELFRRMLANTKKYLPKQWEL